jgi:hypothetical protein
MMLAFLPGVQLDLRRNGADGGDVQKAVPGFVEHLKRQYDRKLRAQALRLRKHWRKADVDNLLLLPGKASEATQRRIRKLLLAEDKAGRGVIPEPKSFEQEFVENLTIGRRLVDPATPPEEWRELHRKMPTYPRLIEAAYRGELARAKQRMPRGWDAAAGRADFPHRKASEIAEEEVAEAADISPPMVHALCQQARDDAQRWAAARPDRGLVEEPSMTADQLRRHLAELAELRELPDLP